MTSRVSPVVAITGATLTLCLFSGCLLRWAKPAPPPPLSDQFNTDGASRDSAPIIVVAVIASDIRVALRYPMQMRRLTLKIENVLKGDPGFGTVAVYYFTVASGFNGPQLLGMWQVGGRRIFWLR